MRLSTWRFRDEGTLVGAFAAALVLAPFASVGLSFRASLYFQALLAVALTGIFLAWLWRRPRAAWRQARSAHRLLWVGVVLYGGAASLGFLVALVRGNDPRRAAGQFLAMGLLVAVAVGAFALRGSRAWIALGVGAATGAAVGAALDLLHWVWSLLLGTPLLRFSFANAINASSASLLALPFALALAFYRPYRVMGWVFTPLLLLDIVGSGVRSLWLVVVPVVLLFLIGRFGRKRFLSRRGLGWASAVVVGIAILVVALVSVERSAHPVPGAAGEAASIFAGSSALEMAGDSSANESEGVVAFAWPSDGSPYAAVSSSSFGVRAGRAFDLTACVLPGAEGQAAIEILWLGEGGKLLRTDRLRLAKRSPTGCASRGIASPKRTRAARLVFRGSSPTGLWRIDRIALVDIGPSWIAPITRQIEFEVSRARSLLEFLRDPSKVDDDTVTIQFRWLESLAVLRQFHSSSLLEKIFGHGLGAMLPLDTYGFDNRGHWIHYSAVNYIHNFYLFLLYKLGILGLIAICAALLCWMAHLFLPLRRGLAEPTRSFVLASLVAWLGVTVWSLAAPEILDFRLAPLWGLLIGVAAVSRSNRLPGAVDGEGGAGS